MGYKTKLSIQIFLAGVFTMLLITFVFTSDISLSESEPETDQGTSDVAGALTGTAEGHNGPVTVSVEMDGDTITAVEIIEHEESPGYSDKAISDIPAAIVEANSTDIEVISGASVSSNAIMEAVDNAVASVDSNTFASEGDVVTVEVEGHNGPVVVDVTFDGDNISAVEIVEHEESPGYSDQALEEIPAAIVEANSTDVEVISGASVTSNAIIDAVNQAVDEKGIALAAVEETDVESSEEVGSEDTDEESSETSEEPESEDTDEATGEVEVDGDVVTVTVEGHNGPVVVEVTFDDNTITAVEVVEHEESAGYSDRPLEEIPAAIVEANSTDVEVVSSASVTSNAIIDAVNLALEEKGIAVTTAEETDSESSEESESDETDEVTGEVEVDGDVVTVTVEGRNGPVVVEVTFDDDNTITAVEIVEHEESDGYSDRPLEEIPEAIVEENSTDVEVISGASVTSEAIINAVKLAVEARE
ncbi:FMN-binding protein [Aerococcaceae bacterium DSM 111176]|nr:FMN-binding protein [Aerococcaceae bacterium DSM 111176]